MNKKNRRFVLSFLTAACLGFGAMQSFALEVGREQDERISGDVSRVIDANTLQIRGNTVRLWGLYVPALNTHRGAHASIFVHQITMGRTITCAQKAAWDKGIIAQCWLGETDLTEAIIAAGHGRECLRDSGGFYKDHEAPFVLKRMPLPESCNFLAQAS